jgi:hypothetical protein
MERGGQTEMISELKREPHQDDYDRDKHERMHREEALDDALKNTFPASDPVSVVQPAPPASTAKRHKGYAGGVRPAGLSKTITLETKALTSRMCVRPQLVASALKSSLV